MGEHPDDRNTEEELERDICVIGMGYVGLQLATAFDAAGHTVKGYDIDSEKIQSLQEGRDPTGEIRSPVLNDGDVTFTTDAGCVRGSDFVIIAVPTPVSESNTPDMSMVRAAGRTTGEHLSPKSTVVLESTVYPGATRDTLIPELEACSGMLAGEDFTVGYSPERIVPGETSRDIRETVKIVSAQDQQTLAKLTDLYNTIIDAGVHEAPTIETAEAAKCLENVQRDLNIALMNEFAISCQQSDIDMNTDDVLEAAGSKWNFHEYHPGLVGGHCIPIDPYFLIHAFEKHEFFPTLMHTARNVNESVAGYVADLTVNSLQQRPRQIVHGEPNRDTGSRSSTSEDRVLIAGLAYKPNTGDIRNSAVSSVIEHLRDRVSAVVGFEPHSGRTTATEEFDIPIQYELSVSGFDALVVPTPHDEFRDLDPHQISRKMNDHPVLVDVEGAFDSGDARDAGFIYRRL